MRALTRAAAWQVYKRLTGGHWDIRLTANRVVRCHPDNTSASSVLYAGLFDFDEMNFVVRYLRAKDNFLDVGANVGVYTLLASSVITEGFLHAFEPSTQARHRFEENVRINALANVVLHPVAIYDAPGNMFLTCTKDSINYLLEAKFSEDVEEVRAVRLDDEVGDISFTLGKMDIEGAELPALRGARRMLEAYNPPVWLVEVSNVCHRYGSSKDALITYMQESGYRAALYASQDNALRWMDNTETTPQNVLMIAEERSKEVQNRLKKRTVSGD